MEREIIPKISVIVPVYNAEKTLARCVDSVLSQSFRQFELVLVDDGSTDLSGEMCDEYGKTDMRVRVIHQNNKGQASARNKGIQYARGEWISFVDADDMIHKQFLEILFQAAMKNNVKISVCGTFEGDKLPEDFGNYIVEDKEEVVVVDEKALCRLMSDGSYHYWVVWSKLIRKEILENVLFSEGRIYEDNAIVCKWLYTAGKIVKCDDYMYFYCTDYPSTTRSDFNEKKMDYLWALEEQTSFYKEIGYKDIQKKVFNLYLATSKDYFYRLKVQLGETRRLKKYKKEFLLTLLKNNNVERFSKEKIYITLEIIVPFVMRIYSKIKYLFKDSE